MLFYPALRDMCFSFCLGEYLYQFMQHIKAVIFDLDGTVANTLPLCIQAFRLSVEPLINRSLSDAEIVSKFGPSEEGTIMELAPAHYDKGIADYLAFYQSLHHICPAPFTGMEEILMRLQEKNIRTAMVTGKGKYSTAISLQHFGLTHYFDPIETGSPNGARKAEGIAAVIGSWKDISHSEIIYVGDAVSDIVASRKVGIPVVAAAWAETAETGKLKELQPDELFYTVNDFAAWLFDRI